MNLDWLQSRPELELHQLIADLLRAMGYQQVTIIHGPLELGRDIVFLEIDKAMRAIWRGVQVKATPMSGRFEGESSMRGLLGQLEAALDTPYTTPNGQDVLLQEIWFINSFPVGENAKLSIKGKLRSERNIHIIDGPALADLVQHYLPELDRLGSQPIEDYLNDLIALSDSADDYISTRMHIKYSLSDIYVPARAYIELVPFEAVAEQKPLADVMGLSKSRFQSELRLLLKRAIPLQTWSSLIGLLRKAADLGRRVSFQDWYEPPTGLGDVVEEFCKKIGLPRNALFAREFHQFHGSYSSAVDASLLARLMDRGKLFTITEKVALGKLRLSEEVKAFEIGVRCPDAFPELDLHQQDFPKLIEGFFLLDDLNNSLLTEVPSAHSEESTSAGLGGLLHLINLRVQDFDSALRKAYGPAWKAFSSYNSSNFDFNDPAAIHALCEIHELSSIVIDYYGVSKPYRVEFDALELANSLPRLLCLGNLGMGKTMLLKRLSNIKAKVASVQRRASIPVLCSLSTIKERADAPLPELVLQAADRTNRALLHRTDTDFGWILDGFDEVQSLNLRHRIVEWVALNANESLNVVLSSRPGAISETLPKMVKLWLQQFSFDQIRSYIQQFPWNDTEDREKMMNVLFSEDRAPLRELASTPILLTMIVLVAVHGGPERLPKRRDDLYASILRLVMGDWDASRGVFRPQTISDEGLRWMLLESTAYVLYADRKRAFTPKEFARYCADSPIGKIAKIGEETAARFTENLLRDCVLLPLSPTECGFFHFSIQEYLAALEMNRDIGMERVTKAIIEYFRSEDRWWEEVLVFYAGLKRTAAPLIKSLHQHMTTQVDSSHPALRGLLKRWLEVADFTVIDSDGASGSVRDALKSMKVI